MKNERALGYFPTLLGRIVYYIRTEQENVLRRENNAVVHGKICRKSKGEVDGVYGGAADRDDETNHYAVRLL